MNSNFKLLYYLKRSKANKKTGLVPIYLRITLDYKRVEISTNRKIDPEKWDSKAGIVNGSSDEVKILNHYLHQFKSDVLNHYNILKSTDQEFSLELLKDRVLGRDKKKHKLLEIFNYHNEQMKMRVGKDYVSERMVSAPRGHDMEDELERLAFVMGYPFFSQHRVAVIILNTVLFFALMKIAGSLFRSVRGGKPEMIEP